MIRTDAVMEQYVALWNATEATERRRLAEGALTEDARLLYPGVSARGWEEVVTAIGEVHLQVPGARFISTSGVEQHHDWVRASWRMVGADGTTLLDGEDVAQLAEGGQFQLVIGFHNPLPARTKTNQGGQR